MDCQMEIDCYCDHGHDTGISESGPWRSRDSSAEDEVLEKDQAPWMRND